MLEANIIISTVLYGKETRYDHFFDKQRTACKVCYKKGVSTSNAGSKIIEAPGRIKASVIPKKRGAQSEYNYGIPTSMMRIVMITIPWIMQQTNMLQILYRYKLIPVLMKLTRDERLHTIASLTPITLWSLISLMMLLTSLFSKIKQLHQRL